MYMMKHRESNRKGQYKNYPSLVNLGINFTCGQLFETSRRPPDDKSVIKSYEVWNDGNTISVGADEKHEIKRFY
jgi:hypothetical protein